MNYKILNLYEESNVRTKRRSAILESLLPYIIEEGIVNVTFVSIAEYLEMERRTLFSYYPSKSDIIVDLAFYAISNLHDVFRNINELVENQSCARLKLKADLKRIVKIMDEEYVSLLIFLNEFDVYFYNLDRDSNAYKRYVEVIAGFKTKNHYMQSVVYDMYVEENLASKYEYNDLVEVIEQSFHAYLSRTFVKRSESKRYNIHLMYLYIDLLIDGI